MANRHNDAAIQTFDEPWKREDRERVFEKCGLAEDASAQEDAEAAAFRAAHQP